MALWGTHFAVGGLCALFTIRFFRPDMRHRWLVITVSGLWAILPDIHWIYPPLREVTKPVIHDTAVSNLFWFHGWIDASALDHYDSRARPYLSIPLLAVFLWVYAMVVVLKRE